jgi:hypothetical protein
MRKTTYAALSAVLILTATLCTACLGDAVDEHADSSNCALLSFSLEDIRNKKVFTSSTGEDSIVITTIPTGGIEFIIDHLHRVIYNTDSIKYGTDLSMVNINGTADGKVSCIIAGTAVDIKNTELSNFNKFEADSMDFSAPRIFTVTSTDGNFSRDYTITVNVHTINPNASIWTKTTRPADFDSMKKIDSSVANDFLAFHSADVVWGFGYPLRTNSSINRNVVVCYDRNSTDTLAQVWTRLSSEPAWSEVKPSNDNHYGCPLLENLCVIRYAGDLYAFGGKSLNGRTPAVEPFERTFCSIDNGITWRTYGNKLTLPEELKGYSGEFETAVDKSNHLWIVLEDGTAWTGKLSSL